MQNGTSDQVTLRLPDGIPVNFSRAADKAGGLVSPVFTADVLSRIDGPVDGRALPGFLPGPPDLAAAFDGATILGMPLATLVESIDLPRPLAIVATPDGGASMTWKDLRLRSSGPFVAHPGTTFEMTVVRSPAETVTRCTITDFTLVLPPGLGDLVRIHFQTLRFEQRPGRSPALDVEGLGLELGGDLGLLKTLQDAVDFGDNARCSARSPMVSTPATPWRSRRRRPVPSCCATSPSASASTSRSTASRSSRRCRSPAASYPF